MRFALSLYIMLMKKNYLEQIPKWYMGDTQFDLILSDDIDSLSSCAVISQAKDWNIEYFYNFNGMGTTKNGTNEKVGVDIALCNGKTFDNHVVIFHTDDEFNQESINPNIINKSRRSNYSTKYCGSTLLLVWSLYNMPIPESEDGKMILLAIDSTYKGFYSGNSTFEKANRHYLCDVLGLDELYECQLRHKRYEFEDIEKKYNIKSKIISDVGILSTNLKLDEISKQIELKLELPTDKFYKYGEYSNIEKQLDYSSRYHLKVDDVILEPFSLALTKNDKVKYSCQL